MTLLVLAGCAVTTQPLDGNERARVAEDARRDLFAGQDPITTPITLAQATARALKYQAEHRQRQMEEAAAAAQLDVAQFDLLPKITANAGYSTRDNEAFGFGITPGGAIGASPSASVERTRTTGSIALTWNLLDFGVSYYRAKQLADQKLIAEERRRKAVQTLMHDVRVAWWRAEAAERLLPQADRLLAEVEQAIEKTRLIESRKLLPPVQTATLRRALLDLTQQIALRRQDLAQAKVDLAALVNAPPGEDLRIAGPASEEREVLDLTANVDNLERMALKNRPEMAEEGYRSRISEAEARKALLGLLPGLSFELGRNYDSNRFLVNNSWTSAGINVAFNLVKAFSLPAVKRSEEAQRAADSARRQAMAMAILAQTRIAAIRYSNVQASIARLYHSVGYDPVPRDEEAKAMTDLSQLIEGRLAELERASFSPRAAAQSPTVMFGGVTGADPRAAGLLREGVSRVIASAGLKVMDNAADVRLELQLAIEPLREGRRPARVTLRAGRQGAPALVREFRSTLSEPIDDEQWRIMGEGAAYRVVGELTAVRITRPVLRTSESLEERPTVLFAAVSGAADPLPLRMAAELEDVPEKETEKN
jgi:outer membrane protein TolC